MLVLHAEKKSDILGDTIVAGGCAAEVIHQVHLKLSGLSNQTSYYQEWHHTKEVEVIVIGVVYYSPQGLEC